MSTQASRAEPAPHTVVGLFSGPGSAETAIRALKTAGFSDQDIGVIMRDLGGGRELVSQTVDGGAGEGAAAAGAATGAATGGMVGGLLGLLGSLRLPGVGPIVVGGVLGSTLVGAGAGAATGGLIGGLIGMGVPSEDARHFDRGFRDGGVVVTVNAEGDRADTAARLMSGQGADLGPSRATRVGWTGAERRAAQEPAYAGPERRSGRV
jgi:hypothetical protein